jgi:hypothetical protein
MKSIVLISAVVVFVSGCQSYDGAFSRPMLSRRALSRGAPTLALPPKAELPQDFVCDLPGGTRLGGNRVTVLSGEYVAHGHDAQGVFWRHHTRGIIRSGNLGRVEEGGVYCPFDPEQRCLIWIVPKDQGPLFLGAAVITPQKPEPDRFAVYVGDVPTELSEGMRRHFRKEDGPNQPPQRNAGSRLSSGGFICIRNSVLARPAWLIFGR